MKKKQKQQLMNKSEKELAELIGKKRSEIAMVQLNSSEEKNTNLVKSLKYDLAVMLTALREQQIIKDLGGDTHE